jgi:catechol 2,3-dioxygenase-like lactoylglutathione lyase family enzyme
MDESADDDIARVSAEVCLDCCDLAVMTEFWTGLLDYRMEGQLTDGWIHLEPSHHRLPTLNLQLVPESKQGKNRLHLDIYVDDPPAWIAKAEALGAQQVRLNDDANDWYYVMADPEGNEFCVCLESFPTTDDSWPR